MASGGEKENKGYILAKFSLPSWALLSEGSRWQLPQFLLHYSTHNLVMFFNTQAL